MSYYYAESAAVSFSIPVQEQALWEQGYEAGYYGEAQSKLVTVDAGGYSTTVRAAGFSGVAYRGGYAEGRRDAAAGKPNAYVEADAAQAELEADIMAMADAMAEGRSETIAPEPAPKESDKLFGFTLPNTYNCIQSALYQLERGNQDQAIAFLKSGQDCLVKAGLSW